MATERRITFEEAAAMLRERQPKRAPIEVTLPPVKVKGFKASISVKRDAQVAKLAEEVAKLRHDVKTLERTPGPEGPRGRPGKQGEKGDTGPRGKQGERGLRGFPGQTSIAFGGGGGGGAAAVEETPYEVQVDEVGGTPAVSYIGQALPGSSGSAAVWSIRRVTEQTDGDTAIEWADGSAAFVHVWDNRASYSYS